LAWFVHVTLCALLEAICPATPHLHDKVFESGKLISANEARNKVINPVHGKVKVDLADFASN
jgi:hypothetical protein